MVKNKPFHFAFAEQGQIKEVGFEKSLPRSKFISNKIYEPKLN